MTQSVIPATGEERRAAQEQAAKDAAKQAERTESRPMDALHTEHGDTTIADAVVVKMAGIAAREVPGVYAMGNAARRALGNLTQRIPGGSGQPSVTGGVSVEKGESQAAIDVSVVIEYGAAIVDVSEQIRENVIRAVEFGTGLEVISVDVNISDVHLPDEDDQAPSSSSSAELR